MSWVDDLRALVQFLQSYSCTAGQQASHDMAARQVPWLIERIKTSPPAADVAGALAMVNSGRFGPQEMHNLLSAICGLMAKGTSQPQPSSSFRAVHTKTQVMLEPQNYMSGGLIKYLTTAPLGFSVTKLQILCEFLVRVGLRWPNEQSSRMCLAIFLFVVQASECDESAKYTYLQDFKREIKNATKRVPASSSIIWVFADRPDLVDPHWKTIYGEGDDAPIAMILDSSSLQRIAQGIPLRSTNKSIANGKASDLSRLMQQMIMASAGKTQHMHASSRSSSSTLLMLPSSSSSSPPPSLLALPAPPQEAGTDTAPTPAPTPPTPAPTPAPSPPTFAIVAVKPNIDEAAKRLMEATKARNIHKELCKPEAKTGVKKNKKSAVKKKKRKSSSEPSGAPLGCSKCRGSHQGCSQCRNPKFSGKRFQKS